MIHDCLERDGAQLDMTLPDRLNKLLRVSFVCQCGAKSNKVFEQIRYHSGAYCWSCSMKNRGRKAKATKAARIAAGVLEENAGEEVAFGTQPSQDLVSNPVEFRMTNDAGEGNQGEENIRIGTIVDAPGIQDGSGTDRSVVFDVKNIDDGFMVGGQRVRKTKETPPCVSVIDLIAVIDNKDSKQSSATLIRLGEQHAGVSRLLRHYKFPGRRQKDTPVTDARGVVTIINLLSGRRAAQFRAASADVIVRYLGGDTSLISDIQRNAQAQQDLPENNLGRMFGQDVEAIVPAVLPYVAPFHLKSVTNIIDVRQAQVYVRQLFGNFTNVHPVGRPDLKIPDDKLREYAIGKLGSQGNNTGRQQAHESNFKSSVLLDSMLTNAYTHSEQGAKDVWVTNGELYEGQYEGKQGRDTELLLFKNQEEYAAKIAFILSLIKKAERNQNMHFACEYTKQSIESTKHVEAVERTKQVEAVERTKQVEAIERTKQAVESTKQVEAVESTKKLELQLEIMKFQASHQT